MITLSTTTTTSLSTDHPTDPFKRLGSKHHHHHPHSHHLHTGPIRSPAAKVDVFYQGPAGGSGSASARMDGLARRSTTMMGAGNGGGSGNTGVGRVVQDQNSTSTTRTTTTTADVPLKGIAGLEARRDTKLNFGGPGGPSGVPSPFARSKNHGLNRSTTSTTGSATRPINTAGLNRVIPVDPSPTPDVFYDPTTKPSSSSNVIPRPASPFTTMTTTTSRQRPTRPIPTNGAGTSTGTPNLLFKPPAPPSQMKRPGVATPISGSATTTATGATFVLPHASTSRLGLKAGARTALNALPNPPGVSNVNLNGAGMSAGSNAIAGPSASKRRKTEMGGIPVESTTTLDPSGGKPQQQQQQQQSKQDAYAEYRTRYTKAFPSFVFCFDWELGSGKQQRTDKGFSVKECREGIKRMGGQVEDFLSRRITHYISNGATPAELEKMMAAPVTSANAVGAESKDKEKALPVMATKVWSLQKLGNILEYLLRNPSVPTPAQPIRGEDDLSYLLEDERLHGTRERDKAAPRADWYYFPKGVHYLLIDDATGESRSIMVKEFPKHRPGEPTPWPIIHETFMRFSETAKNNTLTGKELREKAWRMWVTREESEHDSSKSKGSALFDEYARSTGMLTRSTSLNNLAERARAGRAEEGEDSMMPYQAASGNSVVLTSNIASTSNARSTLGINLTPNGIGMSGIAQGKDRRIMQMSKRVQLLKGQTAAKLSAAGGRTESFKSEAMGEPVYVARGGDDCDEDDLEIIGGAELADDASTWNGETSTLGHRRDSSSSAGHSGEMMVDADPESETADAEGESEYDEPYRESMEEQARQKVLAILQAAKAPAKLTGFQRRELKRARSMGFRIERMNTNVPLKPGYCENCRVKYEDFDSHIRGRRHRKFAENARNFAEVDDFLLRVRRVPKDPPNTSQSLNA